MGLKLIFRLDSEDEEEGFTGRNWVGFRFLFLIQELLVGVGVGGVDAPGLFGEAEARGEFSEFGLDVSVLAFYSFHAIVKNLGEL